MSSQTALIKAIQFAVCVSLTACSTRDNSLKQSTNPNSGEVSRGSNMVQQITKEEAKKIAETEAARLNYELNEMQETITEDQQSYTITFLPKELTLGGDLMVIVDKKD